MRIICHREQAAEQCSVCLQETELLLMSTDIALRYLLHDFLFHWMIINFQVVFCFWYHANWEVNLCFLGRASVVLSIQTLVSLLGKAGDCLCGFLKAIISKFSVWHLLFPPNGRPYIPLQFVSECSGVAAAYCHKGNQCRSLSNSSANSLCLVPEFLISDRNNKKNNTWIIVSWRLVLC